MLIWKDIFTKIALFKDFFMLNSNPLEFLGYLLPFKRYEWKQLFIFNSAWPQCEAFLADFRLLHIQNVVEWALMKINQFCFLHQKAEMHSFAYFSYIGRILTVQQCKTKKRQKIDVAASKPYFQFRNFSRFAHQWVS